MDAFLGAIGLVGVIVGILLIILGKIKRKKYKGGLITIVSLVLFITGLVITSNDDDSKKADQTDTHKVTPGKITNNSLLIDLAVRSETLIEKYDKIDKVKVNQDYITAEKLSNQKDDSEKVYKNIYSINGQYTWQDRRYDYELIISFNKNNVDEAGTVLKYVSEINSQKIDVKLSPVK